MGSRRTAVIVNPRAGSGKAGAGWKALASRLAAVLGPFETLETRAPGDAAELARRALDGGADRLLAVGGDGTFSEVVDGWLDDEGRPRQEQATLGIVPVGTGGDFRRTLGIGSEPEALAAIAAGHTRTVDIGRVSYLDHEGRPARRCFLNIGGFGIGGLVDTYVNQTPFALKSRLGGKISFMVATLRANLRYRNQAVRLSFDGGPPREEVINHVAVANGQFFGGGMWIAPRAELGDGFFDVVTIGDLGMLEMARHSSRLYKGTHLELPGIRCQRARRLEAHPAGAPGSAPVLLEIDGEAPGRLPATFEVVPSALRLAVPAGLAGAVAPGAASTAQATR